MVEVDLGLKRPSTINIAIMDQELVLRGEVKIGLTPANYPPITQVAILGYLVYQLLMVPRGMLEVLMMADAYLGLNIPATINQEITEKLLMVIG